MKTSTTILLLCLFSFESIAQQNGWTVGLDYNPFFYWNYNKKDWNNLPESYPVKPRSFNGLRTGFSVEKQFEKFGVQANVAYSSQIQHHMLSNHTTTLENDEKIRKFDTKYTRHFNHLHLNIYVNKRFEIGYSSQFFLNISLGLTNSILSNFKTINTNYHYDSNTDKITSNIQVKTVKQNNEGYQLIDPGTEDERYHSYDSPNIYSTYMVGLSSQISLSRLVGNHYVIELGVRGDHDITNSENKKYADQIYNRLGGGATQDEDGNWYYEPRSPSYNIRLGPFIALKYRITN